MRPPRALAICATLALAACQDQSMRTQKKYNVETAAGLWSDDAEARLPPTGTVARGDLDRAAALRAPPRVDAALLARGRERYDIFCAPCHGIGGDGDGMIVERGFPRPPSYHEKRLREAPATHFIDVITDGYGVMYSYASRVAPRDRWAIVAYIRALQKSRHATLAEAPETAGATP